MSVPDDAIERTKIAAAETRSYRKTGLDPASLARAEEIALIQRFVASLRAADKQPLRAKKLRLTYAPRTRKYGFVPLRPYEWRCLWTREVLDLGEAWPVGGLRWAPLIPDRGEHNEIYGRDIYAGVVYLPAENRLAEAVFEGLTVQRTKGELYAQSLGNRAEPSFADMLAQREVTLISCEIIDDLGAGPYNPSGGGSNHCTECRESLPAWRLASDVGSLPKRAGTTVEDLPRGGTRETVSSRDSAVSLLTRNLVSARVEWAPAAD